MTAMLILLSVSVIVFVELVVLRRMIKLTNGVIQITGEWQTDGNAVTKGVKFMKIKIANTTILILPRETNKNTARAVPYVLFPSGGW